MIIIFKLLYFLGTMFESYPSASCSDLVLPLSTVEVIELITPDEFVPIPVIEGETSFAEQQAQDHRSPPHLWLSPSTCKSGRNDLLKSRMRASIFRRTISHATLTLYIASGIGSSFVPHPKLVRRRFWKYTYTNELYLASALNCSTLCLLLTLS